MWQYIEESHRSLLQQHGLRQFSDFMTFRGGRVIKQLPSKMILKIELPSGSKTKTFFLKRHNCSLRLGETIRAYLSGFSLSWGRKEWETIQTFKKYGIPTLTPVAAGERFTWLRQESFLMTEDLPGFQSLERFIQTHFIPPLSKEMIREKRTMIRDLAQICKTMHRAGFNHRDFYCCHIFIRQREDGQRDWRILDLQRVDRRRWLRRRWIVKDLAALNYSAKSPVFTVTDRLRFMRHYLEEPDGLIKARPLILRVIGKTEKIMRHDSKLQKSKNRVKYG